MGIKQWALNVHSQWRDAGYLNFDLCRVTVERHKPIGPGGFVNLRLALLGFSVSVTRYGA